MLIRLWKPFDIEVDRLLREIQIINDNNQFHFHKKHSINLAVAYLYENILGKRDCNNSVCDIFLDLAKAFDYVNHQILLNKLEHYGLRENVLSYFVLI